MPIDIFAFWSEVRATDIRMRDKCHPRDRDVLERTKNSHGYNLSCPPLCFAGPLRTATVVLLYLSPGLDEEDSRELDTKEGRDRYFECIRGRQPLTSRDHNNATWEWWTERTKCFGNWESVQSKIAILNVGAYHSKEIKDQSAVAALPSSRVSIDWAQSVLFPEAVKGNRVVVCLRSHRLWGLEPDRKYPKFLFAPRAVRGGHMINGDLREEVISAAQKVICRK